MEVDLLNIQDRGLLVEWLYVATGNSRSFWNKYSDSDLKKLFEINLIKEVLQK